MKNKRNLIWRILWWSGLIFYLLVVLRATLFQRNAAWNQGVVSLFSTYEEAWVRASTDSWKNMILNICMFVPLGFWLPVGFKWFRRFWKTYLLGFLLTLGIEALQLMLSRGIFEVADLVHNTLGAMIGYGLFKFIEFIFLKWKKKKLTSSAMILSQLPLIFTILLFSALFLAYQLKELGNLSVFSYDMDQVQVTSQMAFDTATGKAMVYKTPTLSSQEAEQFARDFFAGFGASLDEDLINCYSDMALYWGEKDGQNFSLWVNYIGSSYSFTDFATSFPDKNEENIPSEVRDASKETILNALESYGITISEASDFTCVPDGNYVFTVSLVTENGILYDGSVTCRYYDNHKFANIEYHVLPFEEYKEFEICSEQEAFETLLSGSFIQSSSLGNEFTIEEILLEYLLDTKGFYQPVYTFKGSSNGEYISLHVPAIK